MKINETEIFQKWMKNLRDRVARAVINARIRRVSLGNFGDVKYLGEGVSELIIDYGPGYRVYISRAGQELVILLCAGAKSSQQKDIENAKEILKNLEVKK